MQKKITFALGNETESFYFRSVYVGNRSLATVAQWGETLFLKGDTLIFINLNFLDLLLQLLLIVGFKIKLECIFRNYFFTF